ncbi:MAG TPA: hypothetical protein VE988_28465 [Gemmataceae bacterium]|nr:hypothetical protein [Gemmataceae bacterium]
MDCKNARLLLEVAHPLATELDARDTAELAGHLSDCPDCGPWAETEHRLDEMFGNAMRAVPVPDGLAQRIIGRLHVERDAWYRGWAVRAAGVAAALLLTVWASWAFWLGKKPALDMDEFVFETEQFLYKPELVEQAFAAKGVKMLAPPNFDYTLLHSHGMADFQSRRVPFLEFFQPGNKDVPSGMAKVYVVSTEQFRLDDAKNLTVAGSRQNIVVRPNDKNASFAYIIVYPVGASLERSFFKVPTAPKL